MEYLVNAARMKQMDQDTIARIGIPSLVLMERAALGVVEELQEETFDLSRVLVMCGTGNNGGDGIAIARLLHLQGVQAEIFLCGEEGRCTAETRTQIEIAKKYPIPFVDQWDEVEYTTIVDAIFGIGLMREIEGSYREIIEFINASPAKVAAVDIPSGISADTGAVMGTAVKADVTVTFAVKKLGCVLYPGTEYCGRTVVKDIGIYPDDPRKSDIVRSLRPEDLALVPARKAYSNKGTYGKVLLIAGGRGMSGAACLAGRAAYRSGCGLVRIYTHAANRQIIQTSLPEAIVDTYTEEDFSPAYLEEAVEWADVIGIGPGLGRAYPADEMLKCVLRVQDKTIVADADALNLLAQEKALFEERENKLIITPHVGEMSRLAEKSIAEVAADLIAEARTFAGRQNVICVLKDSRTIITDGEEVWMNQSGNDAMAKGGSGDCLTGLILGLLAQGAEQLQAAALGVYIHGLAGEEASKTLGHYGVLAGDIAEAIPEILKKAGEYL